ncbi:unnamed protein product, partial [Ectocarpus sp. 12 AP-2014]
MPISSELYYAILSMDAYSRGYDGAFDAMSGDVDTELDVGNARVLETSSFVPLQNLDGSLTIDQAFGFYALAYDTNGDSFVDVISYRGTDDISVTSLDVFHGWSLAFPNQHLESQQGQLAVDFYKTVSEELGGPFGGIALTGH